MNETPFHRLKPGQPLRAGEHNRLLDAVERLLNLGGPNLDFGTTGPKLREPEPFHKWGKITGGPDEKGRYSCVELDLTRDSETFAPQDKPGGLSWQLSYLPAYNIAGVEVAPGTVVKLRRGTGDWWLFNHCCRPAISGSGVSGQGSGVPPPPLPGLCLDGRIQAPFPPQLYLSWFVEDGFRPPGACLGGTDCIPNPFAVPFLAVEAAWFGLFDWSLWCEGGILNHCKLSAKVRCATPNDALETCIPYTDKLVIEIGAGIFPFQRYYNCFPSTRPVFHAFTITAMGPLDCMDVCRSGQTKWYFFLTE